MTEIENSFDEVSESAGRAPVIASLISLVGLFDSVYLTIKHYSGEPVPCSVVEGCETVLTSPYAEIAGVPLAALGAVAYFAAFSFSILAAFGNRVFWKPFGIQAFLMAAFSVWLIYLQGFVIGAFCQFCLISAGSSIALFITFLVSNLTSKK